MGNEDRIIIPIHLPSSAGGWFFVIAMIFVVGVIIVNSVFSLAGF